MSNCYYYDEQHNHCNCYVNENLNELLVENVELQQRITQAYRDESREWREVAEYAQAENDKLRERVSELEELTDHRHYMPQEWYATLQAENAKLKALVRDMWQAIPKTETCGWDSSANACTGSDECHGECALWHRMHDLGIDVDDINQNNFQSTKNLVDLNEVREVDE